MSWIVRNQAIRLMATQEKSLKARNAPQLAAVLLVDVLAVLALSSIDTSFKDDWATFLGIRAAVAAVIPVVVLLLNELLPASWKARLVFWRWKDALPGHRAFEPRTLRDPRIDEDRLRDKVGAFPVGAAEQNRLWYRLFKKVESEGSITHVHRQFLLLRDLACLSLLLLAATGIAFTAGQLTSNVAIAAAGLLVGQYLLAALNARRQGHGMVTSVLALHGAGHV